MYFSSMIKTVKLFGAWLSEKGFFMIEELLAYKRMPLWTAETMPEAVKRKHNTKEGTWGKITVLKGRLKFVEMSE